METWSVGNAVLQGMGLEMTTDFLFFDLPDTLPKEGENILLHNIGAKYLCWSQWGGINASPVQTLNNERLPRVLILQLLHYIVEFTIQLQGKRQHKPKIKIELHILL